MKHENLIQELSIGAGIIKSLVEGVTQEQARFKPEPEARSILEVVCHMNDEEWEDFRPRLDIILHRPGDIWSPIDPEGWVEERKYNERDLDESIGAFVEERQKSVVWLESLIKPDWEAEYSAPFGTIKAGDMLASWVAHDTLHIRQLVELRWKRHNRLVEPFNVRYAGEW